MKKCISIVTAILFMSNYLPAQNIIVETYSLRLDNGVTIPSKSFPGDSINITALDDKTKNPVQYHLKIAKPNEKVNYKMLVAKPDTSQGYSMIIVDPKTGRKYNHLSHELSKKLKKK